MPKRSQNGSSVDRPSSSTPPVFSPAVIRVPDEDFKITDPQFVELERVGGIELSEEHRTKLITLGMFWINDLRMRRSPRPKEFRKSLEKKENTFLAAEKACQWDQPPEYHLVHWAMETSVKGASGFPVMLAALENNLKTMREMVLALKQCLPPDPGRQRPFDDERRLIYLADVFEGAGGKAAAYSSAHAKKGGIADTPFRKFAQLFYSLLPAEDKYCSNACKVAAFKARRQGRTKNA